MIKQTCKDAYIPNTTASVISLFLYLNVIEYNNFFTKKSNEFFRFDFPFICKNQCVSVKARRHPKVSICLNNALVPYS